MKASPPQTGTPLQVHSPSSAAPKNSPPFFTRMAKGSVLLVGVDAVKLG